MKRTIKRTSLLLSLVLFCLLLMPAAAGANSVTMYVNTANRKVLNMRAYNSINADIIAFIPYGAAVTANTMGGDNTWVPVSYNGKNGYCMLRYLSYNLPGTPSSPTATAPAADLNAMFTGFVPTYYVATVTPTSAAGFVNMRWAPSLNAPVRDIYYYGSSLLVLAQNGTWAQVLDQNTNTCGFMMLSFMNRYY